MTHSRVHLACLWGLTLSPLLACGILDFSDPAADPDVRGMDAAEESILPGDSGASPDGDAGPIGLPPKGTTLALGSASSCAITKAGEVKCWANNSDGNNLKPALVQGAAGSAIAVVAGQNHNCALFASRSVKCWGDNIFKQVSVSAPSGVIAAVGVQGLPLDIQAIAESGSQANHTCALRASGTIQCWGSNNYGELGNGAEENASPPVSVQGVTSGVRALATGIPCRAQCSHPVMQSAGDATIERSSATEPKFAAQCRCGLAAKRRRSQQAKRSRAHF
jgi:hypothetical protein